MALSPAKNIGVETLQPLIGTLLRDRPVLGPEDGLLFGSDVIADAMRELHLPYIAMVPGSSFRGLHDSIVNRLGNTDPQIVLCLHEEHAVAVADGYARATGRPIAVGLHANVGLMHATMPIYNAWCDRVPMIIIGANGPADAHLRRPWIDWVHSTRDQALMIRGFIKWDDQPVSTEAALEAILRAYQITTTLPYGPTYVCLDVTQQEAKLEKPFSPPDVARFAAPPAPAAPKTALDDITAAIRGRASRSFYSGECLVTDRTGIAVSRLRKLTAPP